MTNKLPRRSLRLLEEFFQSKEKADFFADDLEQTIFENEDILKTMRKELGYD